MILNEKGILRFLTFESFPKEKVDHGVFSRNRGISPNSFSSLNVGESAGDSRENVVENRKRIFQVFGKPVESIYDVWQIHSNFVSFSDKPRILDSEHEKADAIFTNSKDVSLFMQFADCVPILIYDSKKEINCTLEVSS